MAQLKAQHDAAQRTITLLTSERDALSARLAALQAELKDAATRHAPRWTSALRSPGAPTLLPCRNLPPAELPGLFHVGSRSTAITQAEGSRTAAPIAGPSHATAALFLLPQQLAGTHTTAAPTTGAAPQNAPTDSVSPGGGPEHDGQDGSGSVAPAAEKNRNTAKAEAKLEGAEYLVTLNDTPPNPTKWVINASILASLTGCYARPSTPSSRRVNKSRRVKTPLIPRAWP